MMPKVPITGGSGFIGCFLVKRLLEDGFEVIGRDAMTDDYGVTLKRRSSQVL